MGVEYSSVRKLARDMGGVPMALRREMRPKLRQAGQQLKSELQADYGWSSRIPGAVRMTTSFGSKTGGVRIFVDAKRAPHARPIENEGQAGKFRHPLFGNRDVWVEQDARPTFFPAVKRNRENVIRLAADAVRATFPRGA
jgi:hypothetical protein